MLLRALKFDCQATSFHVTQHLRLNSGDQLPQYVSLIFKQSRVSYSIVVTGLLYLLRLQQAIRGKISNLRNNDNCFILFVVAMMLASKFLQDRPPTNSCWSLNSKIAINIINRYETVFLNSINHKLHIDVGHFENWVRFLFHPSHTFNYRLYYISHPIKQTMNQPANQINSIAFPNQMNKMSQVSQINYPKHYQVNSNQSTTLKNNEKCFNGSSASIRNNNKNSDMNGKRKRLSINQFLQ